MTTVLGNRNNFCVSGALMLALPFSGMDSIPPRLFEDARQSAAYTIRSGRTLPFTRLSGSTLLSALYERYMPLTSELFVKRVMVARLASQSLAESAWAALTSMEAQVVGRSNPPSCMRIRQMWAHPVAYLLILPDNSHCVSYIPARSKTIGIHNMAPCFADSSRSTNASACIVPIIPEELWTTFCMVCHPIAATWTARACQRPDRYL